MSCDKYKELIMGLIDNELDSNEKEILESHLSECSRCREELAEFEKLKSITDDIDLFEPEDKIFDEYWSNIYNRIERSVGWVLLSLCGMALLFYGGYKLIEEAIKCDTVGWFFKAALIGFIAALSILLISVLRERICFGKKDRYKDIKR